MEKKSKIILIVIAAVLVIAALALVLASRSSAGTGSGVSSSGSVSFVVEVTHRDQSTKTFDLTTTCFTVGEALLAEGLIDGDVETYGLYVKIVDGERADYALDGDFWAFYINGISASQGVDQTPVEEGSLYAFKVE